MTEDAWVDQDFASAWDDAGNVRTNPDRRRQLALVADLVAASGARRVLDLGIGSAQLESVLNQRHPELSRNCRVTGVDSSPAMLELASRRMVEEGLADIDLVKGDLTRPGRLPLLDTPDTVVCLQVLHELPDAAKRDVFQWITTVLPPGRPFYLADRFDYPEGAWLDDWRTTWNWMRAESGRDVLDFETYHRTYRAKTDCVTSLRNYLEWLGEAGFEARCLYRSFNRAIIAARVPE